MTDRRIDIAGAGTAVLILGVMWGGFGVAVGSGSLALYGAVAVSAGIVAIAADPTGVKQDRDD